MDSDEESIIDPWGDTVSLKVYRSSSCALVRLFHSVSRLTSLVMNSLAMHSLPYTIAIAIAIVIVNSLSNSSFLLTFQFHMLHVTSLLYLTFPFD